NLFIQDHFSSQQCITGLFDNHTDIEEHKADLFAANLLLPRLGIYELIPESERLMKNKISTETIFKIQQYYSVSIKALIYRLVELDLTDKIYFEKYSSGIKNLARSFGYDVKLYEEGNCNLVIGDYVSLASKLYHNKKISESYYLELVNAIGFDPYIKDEPNGEE
ncbi:MAG: transcriptional regulator, partial [Candidatus Cloacimonetes bacterium]|nr:transcriptional regulator [Candidatus Cloacimonadota bacterium]